MGTMPPLPVGAPPPSPANPSMTPGGSGAPGMQGANPLTGNLALGSPQGGGPEDGMRSLVAMGAELDRALLAIAGSVPTNVGTKFAAARKLIQQGIAEAVQSLGVAPTNETPTSGQYPGASPSTKR
jgi:hypothetical protein